MKAFFVSDRKDKKTLELFNKVVDSFSTQGVKIDKSQIKRSSEEDASNFQDAYKNNMKSIKNADILVAEVTNLSSGIGYLISTALNLKKPVLALFQKNSGKKPSTMIKGSTANKLVFFEEYTSDSIDNISKKFVRSVKNIMDTKFILIISPEIDRYLEWASDHKRMHKAQIVREAVEEMMKKDKEWKKMQS